MVLSTLGSKEYVRKFFEGIKMADNWAVEIRREDPLEERICKEFFNSHHFKVFRRDYKKFRDYAIANGSYHSMRYEVEQFVYSYVKSNFSSFL